MFLSWSEDEIFRICLLLTASCTCTVIPIMFSLLVLKTFDYACMCFVDKYDYFLVEKIAESRALYLTRYLSLNIWNTCIYINYI